MVVLSVAASVAGLMLVQRLVSTTLRKQHNEVAGFIFAVVGVAYAVLLGLIVAAAWGNWEIADQTTAHEANEVAEVFWLAHGLPQPEGRHIQKLARSYAQVVVNREWPLMQEGKYSPQAWLLLDDLRGSIEAQHPTTASQRMLYQEELERMHDLADARRERLLEAEQGIPAILWVVLIVGGVITVGFTYLFGLESTSVHTLMVASLALIISLVLFTVGALDHPFSGSVRLEPGAFQQILHRFATSKLSAI